MKKQRKIEKDNRGVAIYARKSRITNKGDSIGVQFKQCADYAKKELGLDEDYEFLQYEDKGLSGYFSDRPDFQRMLHDVQDGKIKAIVCYKLDRVGRKTADLIRLMDFLEMYHVNLLICSNGINTASGLYKIFIQIFAVIAEFERDIFIKGCSGEDYTGFFQTAGYIGQKTTPVCDSEQCRICAEIPKKGILQREACSDRKNTPATM